MTKFAIIIVISVVVEALVEYGNTIVELVEGKEYKKAIKQLCAIALCVFICFACNADVFSLLGVSFSLPWLGIVLTGIFGSRGSNYISDIIKKIQSIMTSGTVTVEAIEYLPDGAESVEAVESVG